MFQALTPTFPTIFNIAERKKPNLKKEDFLFKNNQVIYSI